MKYSFFLFSLFALIHVSSPLFGDEMQINLHSGKTVLQSERINGIDYVPFQSVANVFFAKSKQNSNSNSVFLGNTEIKCAVGSFYVLLRSNQEMRVAQMSLPAIVLKNSLHVPLDAFIEALISLDVLVSDKTSSGYFIELSPKFQTRHSNSQNKNDQPNDNSLEEIPAKSTIESSKVKVNIVKSKEPDISDQSSSHEAEVEPIRKIENLRPPRKIEFSQEGAKKRKPRIPDTDVYYQVPGTYNNDIPAGKYHIPKSLDRSPVFGKEK